LSNICLQESTYIEDVTIFKAANDRWKKTPRISTDCAATNYTA